jgi:hypothetical protein
MSLRSVMVERGAEWKRVTKAVRVVERGQVMSLRSVVVESGRVWKRVTQMVWMSILESGRE